jgi:hypothetical protein
MRYEVGSSEDEEGLVEITVNIPESKGFRQAV